MSRPAILPHRPEAENALVGAVLLRGPKALRHVAALLPPEDLYQPRARAVYAAMLLLEQRDEAVDVVSLESQLRRTGELELVGGIEGIAGFDRHATPLSLDGHVDLIREAAQARRALVLGRGLAEQLGSEIPHELPALLRERATALADLADYGAIRDAGWDSAEVARQVHAKITDRIAGGKRVSLGFPGLDNLTCSEAGDLIVVGARPSMGKTAFCAAVTRQAVFRRVQGPWSWAHKPGATPVLAASGEQSSSSIMERMVSDLACVDSRAIRQPSRALIEHEGKAIYDALGLLRDAPITWVPDRHANNLDEIEGYARRWRVANPNGPGIIWIDYLQRITTNRKHERHDLAVGDMAKRCKTMARDLGVVVVLLAQLNRGLEQRPNKRPMMSDLRDSGEIEQEADSIVFLYRDCRYPPAKGEPRGLWPEGIDSHDALEESFNGLRAAQQRGTLTAEERETLQRLTLLRSSVELIVGKARNGSIGTERAEFVPEFVSFRPRPAQENR